jgi:hypothetical protein
VRVEDRELIAVVLQEPDLGRDLEREPVRRALGVASAFVADRLAVLQYEQPAGLVRRLLARVTLELGANGERDLQRAPPQNST